MLTKILQIILISVLVMEMSRAELAKCPVDVNSAIQLTTAGAVKDDTKTKVQFKWDNPLVNQETFLMAMGSYLAAMTKDSPAVTIVNGVDYDVSVILFMWGSDDSKGSGHTIDGKANSGELLIIHKKKGSNSAELADSDGGFLTVSVLLQVDPATTDIKELEVIAEQSPNIDPAVGNPLEITLDAFQMKNLLPADNEKFFRYNHPDDVSCMGKFEKIVFKEPLKVSSSLFTALRTLKGEDGNIVVSNFREALPVGDKKVYKSFD